jgi:hypothetical protein
MALVKRGKYWYSDDQADIRAELLRYSQPNGCPPEHFADAVCTCGGRTFRVNLDDAQGAVVALMEVGLPRTIEDLHVDNVEVAQVADHDAVRALTRALHHGRGCDDSVFVFGHRRSLG